MLTISDIAQLKPKTAMGLLETITTSITTYRIEITLGTLILSDMKKVEKVKARFIEGFRSRRECAK